MKNKIITILKGAPVFLDTETTGFGPKAEIIEIAILDSDSKVLFESLVRPTVEVQKGAYDVHGIGNELLADAPSWADIVDDVKLVLNGKTVVIYNSKYDLDMLAQSCKAHNIDTTWVNSLDAFCAMEAAAEIYSHRSKKGRISLANATDEAGITWCSNAHRAVADTDMTVKLMKAMAS